MIDADIAGEARPHGELALDRAGGRLGKIFREQRGADLLVAVGAAGAAHERAVLLAGAEILRCGEATLPEAATVGLGARGGVPRMQLQRGLDADGKTLLCELLVQARAVALDRADADMALPGLVEA